MNKRFVSFFQIICMSLIICLSSQRTFAGDSSVLRISSIGCLDSFVVTDLSRNAIDATNKANEATKKANEATDKARKAWKNASKAKRGTEKYNRAVKKAEETTREAKKARKEAKTARDNAKKARAEAKKARDKARADRHEVFEDETEDTREGKKPDKPKSELDKAWDEMVAIENELDKIQDKIDSARDKADEARKAADSAQDEYDKAQSEAEDAIDKFYNTEPGTQEYDQAVDDANKAIRKAYKARRKAKKADYKAQNAERNARAAECQYEKLFKSKKYERAFQRYLRLSMQAEDEEREKRRKAERDKEEHQKRIEKAREGRASCPGEVSPSLKFALGTGGIDPGDLGDYADAEKTYFDHIYPPCSYPEWSEDVQPHTRIAPEISVCLLPFRLGNGAEPLLQFGPQAGFGWQSWSAQYDYSATPTGTHVKNINSRIASQQQLGKDAHSLSFKVSNSYLFLDTLARIRPPFLSSLPVNLMFDVYAGVNLAFGKLSHNYNYEMTEPPYSAEYTKDQNVTDTSLGLRYGIVCSVLLNESFSIGIEASGGSTAFDSWTGDRVDTFEWNFPGDTGSSTESYEGRLWAYKGIDTYGFVFPGLAVLESEPTGNVMDVHPVSLKFRRFGIRINLSINLSPIFERIFK